MKYCECLCNSRDKLIPVLYRFVEKLINYSADLADAAVLSNVVLFVTVLII